MQQQRKRYARKGRRSQQRGGTFLGLVLGLIVGLAIAVVVALYITKSPTPFQQKNAPRPSEPGNVASQLPPLEIVFSEPVRVLAVLGAAFIIVAIGIADDIWDLDWLTKLAGQIIAAGLLAWQGVSLALAALADPPGPAPRIALDPPPGDPR